MSARRIAQCIMVLISGMTLSGAIAASAELMPLDPVPAPYADKHMPAGWWTDPRVIEEGRKIYVGEAHPKVSCTGCHGEDGEPVRSGEGVRSLKNTKRFSDSYWFWRVAEGIPKTPMTPWKSLLSEDQIWQVVAFMHTFSHGGKPVEHKDYTGYKGQEKIKPKNVAPMVLVPAGEFTMGSNEGNDHEKPEHKVFLNAYYIDVYEVTVGQYAKFLDAVSTYPPPMWSTMNEPPHQNRPVVNVDWEDANNYCKWAGKRLPTEAEWEKAARGTDGRIYPWGNDPPDPSRANYGKEKDKWNKHDALVPVGQLKNGKSPYGVYDLAGNVWEWVNDWYDPDYYAASPARNPLGPKSGKFKVMRGGSWDMAPENLLSARRDLNIPSTTDSDSPAYRNFNSGFRCAKSP
jgi:formylglycine-generating enzyme required for sulfatase activity